MVKATHHQRGAGCSTTPEIRSVSQLKLRLFKTSGARAIERSASFIVSGAVGAASISNCQLPIANCRLPKASRRAESNIDDQKHRQSEIENRKSKIHHPGFSSRLATPMFSASGIFGFGLRMRAR